MIDARRVVRDAERPIPRAPAIPSIWLALSHAAAREDSEAAALLARLMADASDNPIMRSPR